MALSGLSDRDILGGGSEDAGGWRFVVSSLLFSFVGPKPGVLDALSTNTLSSNRSSAGGAKDQT
jgi:hypothetical protein